MRVTRAFKVSGAAALLLATQIGIAASCGFDAPLGNTFTPMHPKSLDVAFAVRDATVAGLIEPASDPAAAGQAGYWRAVGHLAALQRALSAAYAEGGVPVSVLFIDSGLWARLTPGPNGFVMDVHTESAKDGDVVIVTSEPVLAAILEHRLPIADAFDRGLTVVDGDATGAVRRLMVAGFDPGMRSETKRLSNLPPAQLFGPRPHPGARNTP